MVSMHITFDANNHHISFISLKPSIFLQHSPKSKFTAVAQVVGSIPEEWTAIVSHTFKAPQWISERTHVPTSFEKVKM